ncbi:hypothetical protein AGDE_02865 [Angomonas deanei]|nr:hypothetical protein AGDE_02865 [Angomonas deanei]|eukprot:EPY41060.1 hypothetical protein AGDE_02865 [Angomonas deanei]
MQKQLLCSLYRKCLKSIAMCDVRFSFLFKERWAEFIPPGVIVHRQESMQDIVKRSFRANFSTENVGLAFNFLREFHTSLLSIETLGLWEEVASQHAFSLKMGLALCSASFEVGQVDPSEYVSGGVESSMKAYLRFVDGELNRVSSAVDFHALRSDTDLRNALVEIKKQFSYSGNDAYAVHYSLCSLRESQVASEFILNLCLLLLFEKNGFRCSLVGAHLPHPLLLVKTCGGQVISWTSSVIPKNNVPNSILSSGKKNVMTEKSILTSILRKQVLLDGGGPFDGSSSRSLRKEQLIHLMSL